MCRVTLLETPGLSRWHGTLAGVDDLDHEPDAA